MKTIPFLRPSRPGLRALASVVTVATGLALLAGWPLSSQVYASEPVAHKSIDGRPLVQIALLLDTSNSMDGLIEQAKSQLWRMVNEFNHAKRQGRVPVLQVALYEYGNNGLSAASGHVRQVLGFTTDLERVSTELFQLKTNGGEEYCGWVIRDALKQLDWSAGGNDYKAIFIAGNEPFSQGPVSYVNACRSAIQKGVVVNTIHCGTMADGKTGHWPDGAALAEGKFLTINQDAVVAHVAAPQDDEIGRLSLALNETYIGYGEQDRVAKELQQQLSNDFNARRYQSQGSVVQRALTKAGSNYDNRNWDLVDAARAGGIKVEAVPKSQLPAELQKLDAEALKAHVAKQQSERNRLQSEINRLNREREQWVAARKPAAPGGDLTLDAAITATVREQGVTRGFTFE